MPENPTILCVDDEERALFLRQAVLQKLGFEVVTAGSAKQALTILETTPVSLVLSDLLMPEVSGAELAKSVKERYPDLPVVIVSGVNEIPTDLFCADLFVSKLEGPLALSERLRNLLENRQAAQGKP